MRRTHAFTFRATISTRPSPSKSPNANALGIAMGVSICLNGVAPCSLEMKVDPSKTKFVVDSKYRNVLVTCVPIKTSRSLWSVLVRGARVRAKGGGR